MSVQENRRRFARIEITENTVAVDETGFQLGHVRQASGGGMKVIADSLAAAQRMPLGKQMEITVVEPSTSTSNSFNVEIRHVDGVTIGMEFL